MKPKNDTRTRKVEPLSFSDELARTVLDSVSAHIAILDETGIILETNKAWRRYAVNSGMPESYEHRGVNYLEICEATTGPEADDAAKVARGIRAVYGTVAVFAHTEAHVLTDECGEIGG